jgi:hypothetical protein
MSCWRESIRTVPGSTGANDARHGVAGRRGLLGVWRAAGGFTGTPRRSGPRCRAGGDRLSVALALRGALGRIDCGSGDPARCRLTIA